MAQFDPVGLGLAIPEEREFSGIGAIGRGLQLGAGSLQGRDIQQEEQDAALKRAGQLRQMTSQRLGLLKAGMEALAKARPNLEPEDIAAWASQLEKVAEPLGILAPGSLVKAFEADSSCIDDLTAIMNSDDIAKSETEFILSTLRNNPEECGKEGRKILKDIEDRKQKEHPATASALPEGAAAPPREGSDARLARYGELISELPVGHRNVVLQRYETVEAVCAADPLAGYDLFGPDDAQLLVDLVGISMRGTSSGQVERTPAHRSDDHE